MQECCEEIFGQNVDCAYEDICNPVNPTKRPTPRPTRYPTKNPTKYPTKNPSRNPSRYPTKNPTRDPSRYPTKNPTRDPSRIPTTTPTQNPTKRPTKEPTKRPTRNPTKNPTRPPTEDPTRKPTKYPTRNPTQEPTRKPTRNPTSEPTKEPTTLSPTQCEEDREWWYNGDKCTNYPDPDGQGVYNTMQECCEKRFGASGYCAYDDFCNPIDPTTSPTKSPTEDPTKNPTPIPTKSPTTTAQTATSPPTSCLEANSIWYFVPDFASMSNTCTNIAIPNSGFNEYDGPAKCCKENFEDLSSCRQFDVCNPEMLPPEPTPSPTSGSTPTVSKETTTPPTMEGGESHTDIKQTASNDFSSLTYTQKVNTDCVKNHDKVWSTRSAGMVNVCVNVCTVTTNIYEGDNLWRTNVQKSHSDCP